MTADLTKAKPPKRLTWADLAQPRYLRPDELRPRPIVNANDGRTWDMADVMALRRADAPRAIPGHCAPVPTEPPKRKRTSWRPRAVGSHLWPRSRGGAG